MSSSQCFVVFDEVCKVQSAKDVDLTALHGRTVAARRAVVEDVRQEAEHARAVSTVRAEVLVGEQLLHLLDPSSRSR